MTHATGQFSVNTIPDIPGDLLSHHQAQPLREHLRDLCKLRDTKFPGSQPVSFGWRDIEKLKREDYWVCEKSDGIRLLVFIVPNGNAQDFFLIDRHNKYRFVPGFYFPHYQRKSSPLRSSVLDGELVMDVDKQTGETRARLLVFDCLVIDEENVMSKTLLSRTGRLKTYLFAPYERMLAEFPHMAREQPFEIRLKSMQLSYHLQQVLEVEIPRLLHGNDGLIYTCASSGYVVGTDTRIMKWKPPSENSIDFKLTLRFPPLANSSKPDFTAKPIFVLNVWTGGKGRDSYSYFDTLRVDDDEWEAMKESGAQFDDRIAEVVWVTNAEPEPHWKLMRFRDDKPNGNYIDIVESICRSIADGVEKEDLIKHSQEIRDAWKMREREGTATTSARANPAAAAAAINAPRPGTAGSSSGQGWNPSPQKPFQSSDAPNVPIPQYKGVAPSDWSKVSGPAMIYGFYR